MENKYGLNPNAKMALHQFYDNDGAPIQVLVPDGETIEQVFKDVKKEFPKAMIEKRKNSSVSNGNFI